jgi:hypothetical protein
MAGEPQWKEPSGFVKPKRRGSLNPLGRRGRARMDAWTLVRRQLAERSQGWCEACDRHFLEACSGRFEHAHHITPRSAGGRDELSNALAAGHQHHSWIHENPREARALGFLRYGVDAWSQP